MIAWKLLFTHISYYFFPSWTLLPRERSTIVALKIGLNSTQKQKLKTQKLSVYSTGRHYLTDIQMSISELAIWSWVTTEAKSLKQTRYKQLYPQRYMKNLRDPHIFLFLKEPKFSHKTHCLSSFKSLKSWDPMDMDILCILLSVTKQIL